jgi:hypothetical protein
MINMQLDLHLPTNITSIIGDILKYASAGTSGDNIYED